jgi:hypothetical protein
MEILPVGLIVKSAKNGTKGTWYFYFTEDNQLRLAYYRKPYPLEGAPFAVISKCHE